ncbi:hypothetical protein D9M72_332630 [compost metagenome]
MFRRVCAAAAASGVNQTSTTASPGSASAHWAPWAALSAKKLKPSSPVMRQAAPWSASTSSAGDVPDSTPASLVRRANSARSPTSTPNAVVPSSAEPDSAACSARRPEPASYSFQGPSSTVFTIPSAVRSCSHWSGREVKWTGRTRSIGSPGVGMTVTLP